MNAALYRHAKIHAKALIAVAHSNREFEWLLDYDVKVFDGSGSYVLRPDICGLDEKTKEVKVAIEVSDSTLGYDLTEKKALYALAAVEWYIVIDCKAGKLLSYRSIGKKLVEAADHPFGNLESAINDK